MRGKILLLFCFLLVSAASVLGKQDAELRLVDNVNPCKSPWEKLEECESQCEEQRRQGRQEQELHRECQQKCFDEFKREQQEEGQGGLDNPREDPEKAEKECRDSCRERYQRRDQRERCEWKCWKKREEGDTHYQGREQEQEQEAGEKSPYVFQDEHFTSQLRSEHGTVKILQKFTQRSKLLRGMEKFRVAMLEADPQTFVVPNHLDADVIFFVTQGRGTLSLVRPEKRESFNIKRGDVVRIPAGITSYIINRDNNQRLVLANLLRPVSTPGNFETFYGPGGDNPESFYKAFSTGILEAAFNTRRDMLQRMFGQQRKGIIIKASGEQIRALSRHEEGGRWPFGGESKSPYNLLEKRPQSSNQYGSLHRVDADELRQLGDLNVAVSFMNITQGSMAGPLYHSKATRIAVVINGEGYFEMAYPHQESGDIELTSTKNYKKVSSHLRRGVVLVIPAGHPIAVMASNKQNLEIVGFEVNGKADEKMALAGKRNVINQLEREAMELAFGVSGRQVKEVFSRQEEEVF